MQRQSVYCGRDLFNRITPTAQLRNVRLLFSILYDTEQEVGYLFPGQRVACYSADLLLRQYKRVRGEKSYAAEIKEWYNGYHFGDLDVNDKYETLLAGGYIVEPIEENLTYDVLEGSEENLWSLLYLTGYLTRNDMRKRQSATGIRM